MTKTKYPLTQSEFDTIYSKVPRLTVEIILKSEEGVLLTLRTIEPCIGMWHLPGGTVWYGEMLEDAIKRIAKKEIGIDVIESEMIGIIEYPDHVASGYGDPRGLAYLITDYKGVITTDEEAEAVEWFSSIPDKIHPNQDTFLLEQGLIQK